MDQKTASPSPAPAERERVLVQATADFRTLPSLAFLTAVVRRNVIFAVIALAIYAPFAAIAFLRAGSTYQSSAILRFDASDSLDPEAPGRGAFGPVMAFLNGQVADSEFFAELGRRYFAGTPDTALSKIHLPLVLAKLVKPMGIGAGSSSDAVLSLNAIELSRSLVLTSDFFMEQASIARLEATGKTAEDAQRLVSVAGQLLIDQYYAAQAKKAANTKQFLASLLGNTLVQDMAKKATATGGKGEDPASKKPGESIETKQRRQQLQDRIKDLDARMTSSRDRKLKLEAEMSELAQRYGPFHPQMQALKSQIEDLNKATRASGLANEMRSLQDQYLDYATEAETVGMTKTEVEGVDKIVQRLTTKMDRYTLEQLSLEQQIREPTQRLRLTFASEPTLPFAPISSKKKTVFILAAVAGLGLVLAMVLFREVSSKLARDPWRLSWRFQTPCVALFSRKALRTPRRLEPEDVSQISAQLLAAKSPPKEAEAILAYRRLTHWLHSSAQGNVILFAKASTNPQCSQFLSNLANVYGSDYAGRCLVIDFDARDPVTTTAATFASGNVLDYLSRKLLWKDICRPRNAYRSYDLVPAPTATDPRLSELVSSPSLREFITSARKTYKTILMIGLGADQFIENSSLLEHATDCLVVVEGSRATFAQMEKLLAHLNPGKVGGYVHVDA